MFDRKRTEQFLALIQKLTLVDLLGLGAIFEVKEREKFEDYVVDILVKFNEKNRKQKKELLKFVSDVAKANEEIQEDGEK